MTMPIPDHLRGRETSYWGELDGDLLIVPLGHTPYGEPGTIEQWWPRLTEQIKRDVVAASLLTGVLGRKRVSEKVTVHQSGEITVSLPTGGRDDDTDS